MFYYKYKKTSFYRIKIRKFKYETSVIRNFCLVHSATISMAKFKWYQNNSQGVTKPPDDYLYFFLYNQLFKIL